MKAESISQKNRDHGKFSQRSYVSVQTEFFRIIFELKTLEIKESKFVQM